MNWLRRLLDLLSPTAPAIKPPAPPVILPTPGTVAAQYLALLNAERARHDRPAMAIDARLMALAQDWASRMAARGVLDHGDFPARLRSAYPDRVGAENAADGAPDVPGTFRQWLDSPGHYANLMGDYSRTGIGYATSKAGVTFWCADYVQ